MWYGQLFFVFSLVSAFELAKDGDSMIVNTTQGPVKGYRGPEGDYFAFYNIPYATAPTGKDKYKPPLPAPVWSTTFEAIDKGVICPQAESSKNSTKNMQTDCLILNIFIPDTQEKNIPVVFHIHGGGYQLDYSNIRAPTRLVASKKIIIVNFNYRLGINGFLCLGTPDVPGNAGMKDQVEALRWVSKNIANFGGNQNDITIQGYSAGSKSVDLLLLSNMTKGLFHKAIPGSGANVEAVQIDPIASAKRYAQQQNFTEVDNLCALQEFYKTATYEMITRDSFFFTEDNSFVFTPCVERNTGGEIFLNDDPVNILKKGGYSKVPMLYGFSNMEGLFRVYAGYEIYKTIMKRKFSDILPRDLQFNTDQEKEEVAKRVKEFYFGNKEVGDDTVLEYINYFTDSMYAYPHLRSLKLQVEAGNNNTYLYEYAYPDEARMPAGVTKKILGSKHCAQFEAILDGYGLLYSDESKLPKELKKMKSIMREIWMNFITTGTPVVEGSELPAWPPAGADRSPYMELTLTPQLKGQLLPERAQLWDQIYERYYRAPMPPPEPPT